MLCQCGLFGMCSIEHRIEVLIDCKILVNKLQPYISYSDIPNINIVNEEIIRHNFLRIEYFLIIFIKKEIIVSLNNQFL